MEISRREMVVVDAIQVNFSVIKNTLPGEEVRICGELPSLGRWYPGYGVAMNPGANNIWTCQIWLPKHMWFEWKFLVLNRNTNTAVWEGSSEADNRKSYVENGAVFNEMWKYP